MLELTDHAFGMPVVGRCSGPAHAGQEIVPDKFVNGGITAVLTALVGMPDDVFEVAHHLFRDAAQDGGWTQYCPQPRDSICLYLRCSVRMYVLLTL